MKNIVWDANLYVQTWNYANKVHINQTLPASDIPYVNHIGNVAMEVLGAISLGELSSVDDANLAMQSALLHDTIEDTDCTYQNIKDQFGVPVADGVLALTKDENLPTKAEQMLDSLRRIKEQPQPIWMVKLADRITNLQPPPAHWNKQKATRYRDEAKTIYQSLGEASPYLAERLNKKIKGYQKYIDAISE